MATYYGVKGSSNWNSGNWSTTATKDATRTGSAVTPLATDDCILDDWTSDGGGVTWTVNATSCVCKTLVCTGYAGAIAFTAAQQLAASGSVTFDGTHTISGTGTLRFNAAGTLTMDGITFPGNLTLGASFTLTIPENTIITGTFTVAAVTSVLSGAFNLTCANLIITATASLSLVAGKTLTVSTSITAMANSTTTIKSVTASSDAFLLFNGLASACKVGGMTFTDINCANVINNWYGGTLTRTTGIYNLTSESATIPAIANVLDSVSYGGVDDAAAAQFTGTIATRTLSAANDTVNAGYYAATTLSAVDPDLAAANIAVGTTIFGFVGAAAGGGGAVVGPFEVEAFR